MPLKIIKSDITQIYCNAIVNPTNRELIADGGIDLAIRSSAGSEMESSCRELGTIEPGEVKVTPGFLLNCSYVFHTVGPVWRGGGYGEREILESCYRRALTLAAEMGLKTIAFPLISSGAYGYPKNQVLKVATNTISSFLDNSDILVYLVIYNKNQYDIDPLVLSDVQDFIDTNYDDGSSNSDMIYRRCERTSNRFLSREEQLREEERFRRDLAQMIRSDDASDKRPSPSAPSPSALPVPASPTEPDCERIDGVSMLKEKRTAARRDIDDYDFLSPFDIDDTVDSDDFLIRSDDDDTTCSDDNDTVDSRIAPRVKAPAPQRSLDQMLREMDKGFAETLFHFIDKKGISDVDCYKRSNVDKKTFSKIKCSSSYRPSKVTVISFIIGLHLNLEEADHLLNTAGFSLSRSSVFDVIIEYFITSGSYKDIFEVNEVLYKFDQVTLGV